MRMNGRQSLAAALAATLVLFGACAGRRPPVPVETGSVDPGTAITRRGEPVPLLGSPITLGSPLPATALVDAETLRPVDLAAARGRVLLLSLIVSVDTGV